jgi:prepilin-type N-terminal cleavage/methylation domain-containing protein
MIGAMARATNRRTHRHPSAAARGFTLVELMIALVAGLLVSGAVLAFFLPSMRSNGEYVQSTRLTQDLRNTLDLITRDVRRAGSDDDALAYVGNANVSPFTPICLANGSSTTCLGNGGTGDCIIYAYDRTYPNGTTTATGTPGTIDQGNGEVRGIRRKSVTNAEGRTVGVIEYARSTAGTRPHCDGAAATYTSYPAACNGVWCPLSDPAKVDITALTIVNNSQVIGVNPSALMQREFDITLTGRIAGNTEFTRDVQTSLKIRSDCMRAAVSNCNARP